VVKPTRWIWMPIAIAAVATLVGAMPNLDMALETQKELVERHPDDASAHNDLANLFVLAGQNESAEMAYHRALELAPADPAALFNLALLKQQDGQLDEAEQLFRQVLEVDPRNAWSYYQLGVLYDSRGHEDKAVDHYAHAFGLDTRLSLASHNPHVIDNEFTTQALIEAAKYVPMANAETPLVFGEGSRLRDLLVPEEGADEDSLESSPATVTEEGESGASTSMHRGAATNSGSESSSAWVDEDIVQDETTGNRVLTSDSLDRGSQLGKASGGSTGARGGSSRFRPGGSTRRPVRRPQTRQPTTRPGAPPGGHSSARPADKKKQEEQIKQQGRNPSATVQRPLRSTPTVRFRPGTPSTSRLQLELLAPSNQPRERWAKLDQSVG